MHLSKNSQKFLVFIVILIMAVTVIVVYSPYLFSVEQSVKAQDNRQIAYNATVYGFPLVVMDFTRQVLTAVPFPNDIGAPINQFANKRTFPDASFTNVVNPNADTLYSVAWVDTKKEPIILSSPETNGRYYLMPMFNYWTDCFASPGSRTTGMEPGDYAIVGPNWTGTLPENVLQYDSSTRYVWILGRIACNGSSDYQDVWAIQDKLKLTPLSAWNKDYVPPDYVPVDSNVNTAVSPLNQVLALDAASFFNYVCQLMVDNPPYAADNQTLSQMATIGITAGANYIQYFNNQNATVQAEIEDGYQVALAGIPKTSMGTSKNGWQFAYNLADFGTDYTTRASVAYLGLGGNLIDDAFYASALKSSNGTLSSDKQYVLHFDEDEIPPVNGFWSLSMYNDQYLFVNNTINRYNVGSLSGTLVANSTDDSIDIYIQRDPPAKDKMTNWLPAPAKGNFSLTLRLYWPEEKVTNVSWIPPAVQLVK